MKKLGWKKTDLAEAAEKKKSSQGRVKWGKVALGVISMMVWVFCAVVAAQLVVGYLMLWILGRDNFTEPVWQLVYSALAYVVALLLIILVPGKLVKKWRTNRKEIGLTGLPTWQDIPLSLVGFVAATLLGAILVGVFTTMFPWFDAGEAQNTGFNIYMVGLDRMIAFVALVVCAPIAEEIIFRGWLYGKMREILAGKMPEWAGTMISILLVSALFGLVHFQWNVGVNVFALSVVLCGLREITGTIYASILTHMVKNGVAFYLVYVLGIS